MNTSKRLSMHIENLERVLIAFAAKNNDAISLLNEAKSALSEKAVPQDSAYEFYEPAVYNALAVINSAPNQEKINTQLAEAVLDAKEELRAILEVVNDIQ